MGLLDAVASLGSSLNKLKKREQEETEQGAVSEKIPELTLDMKNERLVELMRKREALWLQSEVKSEWEKKCEENEKYWKGQQFDKPQADQSRPMVDNAIFESLETYLPQITRRNPEPMITLAQAAEDTEENRNWAKGLQKKLAEIADIQKLRLKLSKAGRNWAVYLLGVGKLGWDIDKRIPTLKILRPHKLILDPKATIDEDGYTGGYIGEYRTLAASQILGVLEATGGEPGAEKVIKDLVKDDLGTDIRFIEWWTPEYMCWILKDDVLLKKKNPHWNYDSENPLPADPMTGLPPVDAEGNPMTETVPGINHFPSPRMPYEFISVFNLGTQPVDDTSLISQNLANQDRLNKRNKQIDKNVDRMNSGMVISKERSGLDDNQAKRAQRALQNGGSIVIPSGAPRDAIDFMSGPSLPADVFNDVVDIRNRIKDIFGTRGSMPSGIESETTVRGKIINRGLDTDRIGGGISEHLEQFADGVYNWFVQLLYVYDERFMGIDPPPLLVSVKEGSMLPKDSTSIANQAIELASAGQLSLLDLYKRLDDPNPEETAANAWLQANAPEMLFPNDERIQQALASRSQAQEKPPSTSINFKDLPPDGQAQLGAQAGIDLNPEALAAHQEFKDQKSQEQAQREAEFNRMTATEGGGG